MSTLVEICPGRFLAAGPALTWDAMLEAGMPNRPRDITSGARSREEQQAFYADYLYYLRTGKVRPSGVKLAAKPGTSEHEFPPGCAIDVKTGSPTHKWLVKYGPGFGVTRPLLDEGETWHFRIPAPVSRQAPPVVAATPTPTPALPANTEDDDMRAIRFIYDQHRAGADDSKHPDFGSTGILAPWGFKQTSQGMASRDSFEAAKAMFDASGIPVETRHGDVNLLALHRQYATPKA